MHLRAKRGTATQDAYKAYRAAGKSIAVAGRLAMAGSKSPNTKVMGVRYTKKALKKPGVGKTRRPAGQRRFY